MGSKTRQGKGGSEAAEEGWSTVDGRRSQDAELGDGDKETITRSWESSRENTHTHTQRWQGAYSNKYLLLLETRFPPPPPPSLKRRIGGSGKLQGSKCPGGRLSLVLVPHQRLPRKLWWATWEPRLAGPAVCWGR